MPATYADKPTSEWEYSHAIAENDELIDTNEDTALTVQTVNDDGSVTVKVWQDQRNGQEYLTERWGENQVRVGLRDGIIETVDGQSSELATY